MKRVLVVLRGRVVWHIAIVAPLAMCLMTQPVAEAGPDGGTTKSTGTVHSTVENRVTEAALTAISLSAKAVERLAIKTVVVREGSVSRFRLLGGETMVPPGRAIQLSAPFAGTIVAIDDQVTPSPGAMLKKGDLILRLQPVMMGDREVLTPSERISLARAAADFEAAQAQAEGEVSAARVQLDAAQVRLERAQRLRKENATSEKLLDEAKAEFDLSRERLEAAQAKGVAWKNAAQGMHADAQLTLNLVAPFDGVLADLTVAPGEPVGANALVARFISVDPLWVRVPVYVGAMNELNLLGEVRIGELDGRPRPNLVIVERITGTPTADSMSASVDLFFRLANTRSQYRPQQRVGIWIPLRESQTGLIVPWSAILYDYHGGTWVYEEIQAGKFARRRVEVRAIESGDALLSRGLRSGMNVVTDGSAELFGVEFGAGK